jgi:hypothetical protein
MEKVDVDKFLGMIVIEGTNFYYDTMEYYRAFAEVQETFLAFHHMDSKRLVA